MALTDRYVASDGTDTYANSTNPLTPCSLTTALANMAAGDYFHVKTGTYTRTATDTPTNDGSATQPIIIEGCDASWVPIVPTFSNGNGPLITTGLPLIAYNAGFQLIASGANYIIYRSLSFLGNKDATLFFNTGSNCVIDACSIVNTSTGVSASLLVPGATNLVQRNVLSMPSGGLNRNALTLQTVNNIRAFANHIIGCKGVGILIDNTGGTVVEDNVISGCDGAGILVGETSAGAVGTIRNNTIYGGLGIVFSNKAFTQLWVVEGNHITDGGGYAINNVNADGCPIYWGWTRSRDNVSGLISFAGDWPAASGLNNVTTDAGDATSDYVAPAATPKDLNLLSTAAGFQAGLPVYECIGALNRLTPTLPAVSTVWNGTTFGYPGAEQQTGTKRASSIANCTADNIRNAVSIDDVTGNIVLTTANNLRTGIGIGSNAIEVVGDMVLTTANNLRMGIGIGSLGVEVIGDIILTTADNLLDGIGIGSLGTEVIGDVLLTTANNIRNGIAIGSGGIIVGNIILPAQTDVRISVGYGAAGVEFWGLVPCSSPIPGVSDLNANSLMQAVYEHLVADAALMVLLDGGIHDTMARWTHVDGERYPYLVLTVINLPDDSNYLAAMQTFYLQTDLYDDDTSGMRIGQCSALLNERLADWAIADPTGEYMPFIFKPEDLRRLQERPGLWRISQDYRALAVSR